MKIDGHFLNSSAALQKANTAGDAAVEKRFDHLLDSALKGEDDKKLREACQELESVFLNKMFDAMRATIPHSDLINRGFATETYEAMLYQEYAKDMSKTGSLGIADILYKQLSLKTSEDSEVK